jgi:hypothetical protein
MICTAIDRKIEAGTVRAATRGPLWRRRRTFATA